MNQYQTVTDADTVLRDGKVVVLHAAGYTEDLAQADLYYVE